MAEHDEREQKLPELRGINPAKPFYMAMSVGNSDGSIDEPSGIEAVSDSEADCVSCLKDLNQEYPTLDGYVFYCVPVAHVWRGKPRVTKMKKPK